MILDDNLQTEKIDIKLTDQDIFVKIWFSPRIVFRYINDNSYNKYVYILIILAGINGAFGRAISKAMGNNISIIPLLVYCLILGGLIGWITFYISSVLLRWTGKLLNGKSDTGSILRVMAHAYIPKILTIIQLVPQLILYGTGLFQGKIYLYNTTAKVVIYSSFAISLITSIWSLVLLVVGISEVQKFSIGKSILNVFLPVIIILGPFILYFYIRYS